MGPEEPGPRGPEIGSSTGRWRAGGADRRRERVEEPLDTRHLSSIRYASAQIFVQGEVFFAGILKRDPP